jgi:hypothetical protein
LQNITWEETKTKAVDAVLFLTGASPRVQGEEARSEEEAVDNQVCIRGPIADGCFPDPFRSALPPLYHWYLAGVVEEKTGMTDRNSETGVLQDNDWFRLV